MSFRTTPGPKTERDNGSQKAGTVIKSDNSATFKLEDIRTIESIDSDVRVKTPLKLNPPVAGVVLVESKTQIYDDEYFSIESEIKFLKQLESLKATPKFHFCFYEYKTSRRAYYEYYIVQQEVGPPRVSKISSQVLNCP